MHLQKENAPAAATVEALNPNALSKALERVDDSTSAKGPQALLQGGAA